jgi:hypothetical protein
MWSAVAFEGVIVAVIKQLLLPDKTPQLPRKAQESIPTASQRAGVIAVASRQSFTR